MGSIFEPETNHSASRNPTSTIDALPTETADVERAIRNARSAGISHIRIAPAADLPDICQPRSGVVAIRQLSAGRIAVDVAVVADLSVDPHPPGANCFEWYELLEAGNLLTPDLRVPLGDGSDVSLIALYGFVTPEQLDDLVSEAPLTVRVRCTGRPDKPSSVDYPLEWADLRSR